MKRTLKSLLAIAGLAFIGLGSLLIASPSYAQVVTCQAVDSNNTQPAPAWPAGTNTVVCSSDPATITAAAKVLQTLNKTQLLAPVAHNRISSYVRPANVPVGTPKFFVFKDKAEADLFFAANTSIPYTSPSASTPAVTQKNPTTLQPYYTIIFANVTTSAGYQPVTSIGNKTAHEEGHWVDYLFAPEEGQTKQASDSTRFGVNLLNSDWNQFQTVVSCNASSLGTFNQWKDAAGNYFCNGTNGKGSALQGSYVGKNPKQVLQSAFPGGGTFTDAKEFFAEEFALLMQTTDVVNGIYSSYDQYYNNPNFAATKAEVKALAVYGRVATQGELFAAGYQAIPYVPKAPCQTFFSTPGTSWPDNNHIYTCTPSGRSDTVVQTVRNTVFQANSAFLKPILSSRGVDVFVFENIAAFQAYTDLAGATLIPEPDPMITGFTSTSGTAAHPAPFIVIIKQPVGYSYAQVANFELGRAVDYLLAISSSGYYTTYVNDDMTDINAQPLLTGPQLPASCTSQTTNKNRFLCSMQPTESPSSINYPSLVAATYANLLGNGGPYPFAQSVITNYFRYLGAMPNNATHPLFRSRDFMLSRVTGGANQ